MYTVSLLREWKCGGVDICRFCFLLLGQFLHKRQGLDDTFSQSPEINGVKSILTYQQGEIVFSGIIGEGNEK